MRSFFHHINLFQNETSIDPLIIDEREENKVSQITVVNSIVNETENARWVSAFSLRVKSCKHELMVMNELASWNKVFKSRNTLREISSSAYEAAYSAMHPALSLESPRHRHTYYKRCLYRCICGARHNTTYYAVQTKSHIFIITLVISSNIILGRDLKAVQNAFSF